MAHALDHGYVVRYEEHRQAMQLQEQIGDLSLDPDVQGRDRLVDDEQPRRSFRRGRKVLGDGRDLGPGGL